MDHLRWILAAIGLVILAGIYLWGVRARIREQLRERRRRAVRLSENEPVLENVQQSEASPKVTRLDFGNLGKVGPEHHLAEKILVDVEITPVNHADTQFGLSSEARRRVREEPELQLESVSVRGAARQPAERYGAKEELEPRPESELGEMQLEPPMGGRQDLSPGGGTAELPQQIFLLTVMASQGRLLRGSRILETAQELGLKLTESGVFDCFAEDKPQGKPIFSIGHLREPGTFDSSGLETLSTPGLLLFMQLPGPMEALAAVDFMVTTARRLAQRLDGSVCDERRNKVTTQSIIHLRSEAAEFERRLRLQQARH